MNGGRAKMIVVGVFVLTLGAGMAAGILASRLPHAADVTPTVNGGDSPLAKELDLTSEQSAKMQKIWEGVRDLSVESLKKSEAAKQKRDDAIRALIPADKVDEYNKVDRDYQDLVAAMKGRREAAFDRAVRDTEGMLNETQRKKYKEILEKRLGAEDVNRHDPLGNPAEGVPGSQPSF
ncbi:MAG TPA: hypothetical protein VFE47_29740 [Tepidisphaeraceae bacterium]|jgi:Spy/CpxP family protein refolding chaperone|nr:hypothetical protein [Tepidisphaeraceae bacterium]